MKIGIRVQEGGENWLGGVYYVSNLIKATRKFSLQLDPQIRPEIALIHRQWSDNSLYEELRSQVDSFFEVPHTERSNLLTRVKRRFIPGSHRGDLKARTEAQVLRRAGFTFVYPYQQPPYPVSGLATGGWIPDFQHRHLPELFSADEIAWRNRIFSQVADTTNLVVVSSEAAGRDFASFHGRHSTKARVMSFRSLVEPKYLTVDPQAVCKKYHLPDQFFLISNQLWKHKNHLVVLEAAKLLQTQGVSVPIVCTGALFDYRHPKFCYDFLQAVSQYGLAGNVILLGVLPKLEQIQILRSSITVIQPSLFEGWSTIVEEARALGKPLILSDIDVHQEQAPPDCSFFSGSSACQLADLMQRNLNGSAGFQKEKESRALALAEKDAIAFGQRFFEIAKEASLGMR